MKENERERESKRKTETKIEGWQEGDTQKEVIPRPPPPVPGRQDLIGHDKGLNDSPLVRKTV